MKSFGISTCAAALLAMVVALAVSVQATWQVSLLSDIHFDPLYGQNNAYGKCSTSSAAALGQSECDAPAMLVESTVAELTMQKSDMTIYSGDYQRHHFGNAGITAAQIFTPLSEYIMSINTSGRIESPAFAGSWGNNDVVPDYFFDTTAASQPELEERVQLMKDKGVFTAEDATTFSKCAYYARRTATLSVIVLHTLLWSTSVLPSVEDGTDPCGQFAFLETELAAAKANEQKVIVVGHIPPVLDIYQVLSRGSFNNETTDMFWKSGFQARYEQLIAANKDLVKLQLFGHTHLFNIFAFVNVGVPAIVVPAITPLFGNTPAYLLSTFSDDWELQELSMRFLQDSTWVTGMDVKGALGLQNGFSDVADLQTALYDLHGNTRMWNNYLQLHSGGLASDSVYPDGSCNAFCRFVTTCMQVNNSHADIKNCVSTLSTAQPVEVNLNGNIVTIVLLLGVVIAVTVMVVLYHIIPKIRAGELKFSKFEFDIRAQLLNATPKKEKIRRKAEADERRAARYRDDVARHSQFSNPEGDDAGVGRAANPRREGDEEMVSVPVPDLGGDLDRVGFEDAHARTRE